MTALILPVGRLGAHHHRSPARGVVLRPRDLTEHFWVALDGTWYVGGGSSVDDVALNSNLNNFGVGFTAGYSITQNLSATVSYKTTIFDGDPAALKMDGFMVSVVYGWHSVVEGMKRLKKE
jgi:hypothetical protein